MKFKNLLLFVMIVLTASAAAVFSGCNSDEGQNKSNAQSDGAKTSADAETKVEIGYEAPDFEVELLGGKTAKLSDYRGKAVLINFWATWCGPCTGEMPDIQRLSEAFAGDLSVIAVNCSEKKDKVETFIADNGYTFDVGLDESGAIQKKYPANGIPYSIIVDPAGIITEIHLGAGGDMFSVYEKDVNAALGK
ncbi:MAG: TlpA family protein disulfide reductase [Oscillospiraceae bacterium]|nr:TlpA family protein disulfide reductase [Oscillospiraceae bacterium]